MPSRTTHLAFSALVIGLGAACAQDDERRRLTGPTKPPAPPADPDEEMPEEEAWEDECAPGDIRSCKVMINEDNCFVGEQRCEHGYWSDCLDPGDFEDPTGSVS